jgi:Cu/Ag efflux protein CusF
MKFTTLALLLCIAIGAPAMAQPKPDEHAGHHPAGSASAPVDMTDAEVRKVDADTAKITLKHAEIRNLDMPAMTMVFRVKDASMLDQVKAGDRIRFEVDKIKGAYTVLRVEPAR